jgi:ketosteroid isomerase-like protein
VRPGPGGVNQADEVKPWSRQERCRAFATTIADPEHQEAAVDDVNAFVAEVVPQLRAEVEALHNGDLGPRLALWSHSDPVTLLGAWLSAKGWQEIEPAFQRLAASFHGSGGVEYEVLAADTSGNLGYLVAIERSIASVGEQGPTAYALRVTTVLRRENGAWKIVHRHADPLNDQATNARGPLTGSTTA